MNFSTVSKNEILWRIIQSNNNSISQDLMTQEEKNAFLDSFSYMPHKGCGGIQVGKGQEEQAIKLLEEYVGEYEFKYYPSIFYQ